MWTFQGTQTNGTPICDLWDARSRKVTLALASPPTFTWDTDGDAVSATLLTELTNDVIGYRDGTALFRGRIGPTQDTLDASGHSVSWTAVGYEGALARRVAWTGSTRTWTATDQALIVKALIDGTQALTDGDLGIDTSGLTATGRTRDYSVDLGKGISDAIHDLSTMIDGFDFSVEPDMTAHVWYPQRGTAVSWAAVWGATITSATRTVDTSSYASDVLGTGGDTTTPHTSSRTPRTLGRWETSQSWSDVTIQSTLNAHTDGELALDDWFPSWSVTVDPGRWSPSDAWLGDTIGLHVHDGRLDVSTTGRIVAISFDIGDQDAETVTFTLDRVVPNLSDKLGTLGGRVGNLERR